MNLPRIKLSPVVRISAGLISIIVGWILLLDLLIGIWPNQDPLLKEMRERTSENLAIQASMLLESRDYTKVKKTLQEAVYRDHQINSLAIRTITGEVALQVGDHARYWKPVDMHKSTLDFVRVGIQANRKPWGELQIAFKSASPQTVAEWLRQPVVLSLFMLTLGGLILYTFYLRRVFNYLDPSSTIPDRVMVAFDAFSEGVMMVDRNSRIVLANHALRDWIEESSNTLFGKAAKDLPWLKAALHVAPNHYPWVRCMETQEPIKGLQIEFKQSDGSSIKAIVNCTPIMDAGTHVRGCLITFNNVTELDRINVELRSTMSELVKSREEIEKQNAALRNLATRDPLTSCLNRRAFFEDAENIFAQSRASGRPLSCIMSDIDHFKQFNDKYGHAIGDKVLIAVSRALFSGLRAEDMLCRYGGEEFCILLPDATTDIAFDIAERLRIEIETQAGASIRDSTLELKVCSSFGLATLSDHAADLAALIDQADQSLYAAKEGGRNCVKIWTGPKEEAVLESVDEARITES